MEKLKNAKNTKSIRNTNNAKNIKNVKIEIKYSAKKDEDKKRSLVEMVYIFTICSILGWIIELAFVYIAVGKLVNRGVLFAPMCCIYGFGALILYMLFYNLKPTKINIPYAFFIAAFVLGAFELLCGLGFKYILGIQMWNYDGFFLEILDYTTIPIMIGWGILGTLYVFFIQPLLDKIISFIPETIRKRLAIIIVCYLLIDFGFSVFHLYGNPELLQKMVNPEL